jgi:uncharacterized membrane protein
MIEVTLYSRQDCHLCEQARADLDALRGQHPHRLIVIDVDSSPELRRAYGFEVPVIEIGPYTLRAPIDRQELQMTLGAARDRADQIESLRNPAYSELARRSAIWTRADSVAYWFSRHYLALFNLFILIYVGLPFLAPVLMSAGATGPARLIYRSYSIVCHQLAFRSFFLFGEQPVYPRQSAGVPGLIPYEQATTLGGSSSADDLLAARSYVGDPATGYKIALCQRDISIYLSILAFGLLYAITGRRLPGLPWYLWLIVGILPVGIDGLSQLLSQPPFNFIPIRESSPFLRSFTGFLFGFTTAWFGYPMVEESMRETVKLMARKRVQVQSR